MKPSQQEQIQININKGECFQRLMDDPAFGEAIRDCKQEMFELIARTTIAQTEEREQYYLVIHTINTIFDTMSSAISVGIVQQDQQLDDTVPGDE